MTVEFLAPVDREVTVEVHTEESLPAGPFPLAGISEAGQTQGVHAVGVVRENGQIAAGVGSDLMLTISEQQGVSRIDEQGLDPKLQGPGLQAWKYYTSQFQLLATVTQVQPRVTATQDSRLDIHGRRTATRLRARPDSRAGRIVRLQLRLPPKFVVDDVICDAMQERTIDPAGELLSVRLKEKTLGALRVTLRGHRILSSAGDQEEQDLPLVEPLGVEREIGVVHLFAPSAIEVATNEKELLGVQPYQTTDNMAVCAARLTSAWSYTRRPVRIPVRTTRKPTRLSASIATLIDVQPEVIEVTTQLDLLVEFAGLDTFRFLVPADISDRIQIELQANDTTSVPIKQKTSARLKRDGWHGLWKRHEKLWADSDFRLSTA